MFEVKPVKRNKEFREFVRLPRRIYSGMTGFVAPLDLERQEFFHLERAPFYQHGHGRYWLAYRDSKVVGRISAQIDTIAIKTWNEPKGLFGALDSIDDGEVVAGLLGAAAEWLTANGMTCMLGPLTPSIHGEVGAQLTGQDSGSMTMMPWHPHYLCNHIAAAGFRKAKDVLSYTLRCGEDFLSSLPARRIVQAGDAGSPMRVRNLDMARLEDETEIIRNIYNDAWQDNWGHVPISAEESANLAKLLRFIVGAKNGLIAEIGGEPAGVALLIPNIYECIVGFDGRLLPVNWLKLAWRVVAKRYCQGRVILFGVAKKFQLSRDGNKILSKIIDTAVRQGLDKDFDTLELGWVLEDNRSVRRAIEFNGGVTAKRYRIYERDLAAS